MSITDLVYAVLAGVIPSLLWLFFWNKEDSSQPEPRTLLAGCFFAGMLAVLVAITAEQNVAEFVTNPVHKYTLWAFIEELLKFIAIGIVALNTKSNDEPIDAMIYAIAVALGFAALENALFITGALSGGNYVDGFVTGNMRFMGATLVHVVSSALIGFGLSYTFYMKTYAKVIGWVVGIIMAVALHASFNLNIIGSIHALDTLKTFGWIWVTVVIMIVLFEEAKGIKPHLLEKESKI